jgi:hypothetical protein
MHWLKKSYLIHLFEGYYTISVHGLIWVTYMGRHYTWNRRRLMFWLISCPSRSGKTLAFLAVALKLWNKMFTVLSMQ